eukprot:scpid68249/ scgid27105/ 
MSENRAGARTVQMKVMYDRQFNLGQTPASRPSDEVFLEGPTFGRPRSEPRTARKHNIPAELYSLLYKENTGVAACGTSADGELERLDAGAADTDEPDLSSARSQSCTAPSMPAGVYKNLSSFPTLQSLKEWSEGFSIPHPAPEPSSAPSDVHVPATPSKVTGIQSDVPDTPSQAIAIDPDLPTTSSQATAILSDLPTASSQATTIAESGISATTASKATAIQSDTPATRSHATATVTHRLPRFRLNKYYRSTEV